MAFAGQPIFEENDSFVVFSNLGNVMADRPGCLGKLLMSRHRLLLVPCLVLWISGCASLQLGSAVSPGEPSAEATPKADLEKKSPGTLLEWTLCKKPEEKDSKENGKDKDADKAKTAKGKEDHAEKDSADDSEGKDKEKADEPKRIDPDRPHLPESSTTVGVGRAVLEAGYTYNTSGGFFPLHSFPEALLRIGVCADWLEVRIAQNITSQSVADDSGGHDRRIGADDLQLGVKLALTEQQQCLPESALILQMTVPSGTRDFTANRALPGVHYDCTWEVIKDLLSVETVLIADGAVDDHGHSFVSLGHGVTAACDLTKKLEAFGEVDSFYASGDSAPPQHYFVSGLVYFITPNCEIDVRAGVGLNHSADGYLIGAGFAIRR
jgi:hypothetical protein